ncbi:GAF and ANTAR domain-containing protein [Pseudonocardia oroxyli]|uniref:GAF and ANTAR domain-containing protein n=1 Tax=Pseudonocardia oroxyli TaxID=366584 RepID=UPI0015A460AE|nr:GAF and ANTAR domain-containing protein [Pseudonocardia oroxyli]
MPRDVADQLQRLLIGADGVEAFLAQVAQHAAGAVENALSCGLTVGATRSSELIGATSDKLAAALDEIQYDVDNGPCLTCLRTVTVVAVDDIAHDQRWPAFSRRGRQAGAGSSLSIPLTIDGGSVGALNLYSRSPYALTEEDRRRAMKFADQATGAIALARRLAEREARARHLEIALSSRSTIDQAIGIIMGQTGRDPGAAFELLRTQSQHTNRKLRDVAAEIVAHTSRHRRA